MRTGRTLPPAAAPVSVRDLVKGLAGAFSTERRLEEQEAQIQKHFGVKHVFCVSSGKAALTLILVALKSLSPRRRVVIPGYTCFSVPSSVVKAGLNPAACDVDPRTLDFDFRRLERALDPGTLCVIPTHMLGLASDVERVKALAKREDIAVVEDAAQAMGGRCKGRLLGTLGDVGFFSLGRGKNITCGSGGIILTNSDSIAQAIRTEYVKMRSESAPGIIRNWLSAFVAGLFVDPRLYWLPSMLPFLKLGETKFFRDFPMHRMDGTRAGILSRWRERLEKANLARSEAAREMIDLLGPKCELILSEEAETRAYLRLPLLVRNREIKEELCAFSKKHGLGISPLYPTSVAGIRELEGRLEPGECPAATMIAERLVTLPVHHLVKREDRERVCEVVRQFHERTLDDARMPTIKGLKKLNESASL